MTGMFRVMVPHDKKPIALVYPWKGHPLYTKLEAVKVMESFERKCPERVQPGHKLEIWAEGPGCRFSLADWREDFNGCRTDGEIEIQFTESLAQAVEVRRS